MKEGRKEAIFPYMEVGKLRAIHQRLHVRSLKAHFLESLLMDVTSVSGLDAGSFLPPPQFVSTQLEPALSDLIAPFVRGVTAAVPKVFHGRVGGASPSHLQSVPAEHIYCQL